MQTYIPLSFVIFILAFCLALFLCLYKKNIREIQTLLPVTFILFFGMYVIPFGINVTFNHELGEMIYQNLPFFKNSIAFSFILSSVFIVGFAGCYNYLKINFFKKNKTEEIIPKLLTLTEKIILGVLTLISLLLLQILGKDSGGLWGLILKGYNVTELFIGKGHLVNAFSWLCGIVLLFLANAFLEKKSRIKINLWIASLIFIMLIFAIMGRRGVIIVLFLASIFLYHFTYKNMGIIRLILLCLIMFFSLNNIGLIRKSNYKNLGDVISNFEKKNFGNKNSGSEKSRSKKWTSKIYVFTTGQFAQPYQTFPHMIERQGEDYTYGFGKYHFQQFALIVPNALWKDRPLTLAQDYAKNYRNAEKLNQGILFFALAVGYMDFGWFGIILYCILIATIIKFLAGLFLAYKKDVLIVTFTAIIFGNLMSLVISDPISSTIVLIKGMLFPVIIIFLFRWMRNFFWKGTKKIA